MTYWRMQLHPAAPGESVTNAIQSLAAGYVGLDFAGEVGDLRETQQSALPQSQKDYWAFAHEMQKGDSILVIAHHFPLALATVSGDYNYIRNVDPRIGVWFRHFRAIENVRYYADFKTNALAWERTVMTDTISPLRDKATISHRLIDEWRGSVTSKPTA
jgi:hypothetical protein